MARCCSPYDEVQSRGGGYAIHDCLVLTYVANFSFEFLYENITMADRWYIPIRVSISILRNLNLRVDIDRKCLQIKNYISHYS